MVEISKYGSGEGSGRVTCPSYSTAMRQGTPPRKGFMVDFVFARSPAKRFTFAPDCLPSIDSVVQQRSVPTCGDTRPSDSRGSDP